MKIVAWVYLITIVTLANPLQGIAQDTPKSFLSSFFTGNSFQTLSETAQIAYVAGAIDTWILTGPLMGSRPGGISDCLTRGKYSGEFTTIQAKAIVEKYLKEHPQDWNLSMSCLVTAAMGQACQSP